MHAGIAGLRFCISNAYPCERMPNPALVDLNLIRSFVAIYETRSLTAAAARLYVTQPAVSQALARLRRDLNDPLFRREGRMMEPSPLAVSLFPGFRDAIAGIDRTIDGVVGFDPAALEPSLPHRTVGARRDRLLSGDLPCGACGGTATCASRRCPWMCRRCPNGSRRARSTWRSPPLPSQEAFRTWC